MKMRSTTVIFLVVIFAAVIVNGCGGGESSSDSVDYTGNSQASVIDTTTAVSLSRDVAMEALEGDSFAETALMPFGLQGSGMISNLLDPDIAAGILMDALKVAPPAVVALDVRAEPMAYECFDNSGDGDYSGDAYAKICGDYDDATDEFTSIDYIQGSFDNYSDDGVSFLDGTMIIDLRDGDVELIFRDFSYEDSVEEFYMDGTLTVEEAGAVSTLTFNLFAYDSVLEEGVWFNDVTIVQTDNEGYVTVSISGRIYDFSEGYIDIETESNLVINDGSEYPDEGTIVITGAEGITITMEVDSDTTGFYVYVDLDGDGVDDWQTSSVQPWVES